MHCGGQYQLPVMRPALEAGGCFCCGCSSARKQITACEVSLDDLLDTEPFTVSASTSVPSKNALN